MRLQAITVTYNNQLMQNVAPDMNTIADHTDPNVIAFALEQSYNAILLTDANSGEAGHLALIHI